jgi:hypothetical protein
MLRKDPDKAAEKQARKEADKAERDRQAQWDEWLASPQGRARTARESGAGVFQIAIPLEQTERAFGSGSSRRGAMRQSTQDPTSVIDAIEAEGWHLEHAGYLFRETGSVSRDKFLSSGQTASVTGEIVGIYLFRARTDVPPAPPG